MKKVLLGLIVCGFMTATCKKEEEEKACYACTTKMTGTMSGQTVTSSTNNYDHCDLSAADAKDMEGTVTTTSNGMTVNSITTCSKK